MAVSFFRTSSLPRLTLVAALAAAGALCADEAHELYDQGVTQLAATNMAGARVAFEQLIGRYPASDCAAPAQCRLAQLLVATDPRAAAGYYAAAAGCTNLALAEVAAFGRGEALYQAADWSGAADAYAAVRSRFPDGTYAAQSLYSQGWALFQANAFADALRAFRQFRDQYPAHALAAECLLKTGDCLRQLGQLEEARQVYEQLGSSHGRLAAEALAGKARVLEAQRNFAAAQSAFCAAAQAYGSDAQAAGLLFNAGRAALEVRQYAAAADLFGQVQQAWPTNPLARPSIYWQSLALFHQGRCNDAAAKMELLRQVGVPPALVPETILLQARILEACGRYAESAALYACAATNESGAALAETAAAGLVTALEKSGDLAAAAAAGAAFAQRFPASEWAAAALHNAGWCYWNLKQPDKARELFTAVTTSYGNRPQAVEAAFMKGRAAEAMGLAGAAAEGYGEAVRRGVDNDLAQHAAIELMRLDQAAKHYENALSRSEAFLGSHTNSTWLPRAHLSRAEALLELGRLPEALLAYREVGGSDPGVAAAADYGAAWVLRRQEHHCEAAAAFAKVAAGTSAYAADALFWSARSYEDAGLFDAASTAYGACLRQVPPGAHADEAAYRQAYCLWQTHKPDDAARLYNSVIQERTTSPFAANALYDLAWVMLERGKKPEARQRFEEFAQRFPQHLLAPDAHFRSGELACEQDEFAAAAAHYEVAAGARVAFRDKALYKLGWAREKLGEREAAVQSFLLLARLFPASEFCPEAQYHAGCLLQELGRFDAARAAFAAVADSAFSEKAACGVAACWHAAGRHRESAEAYGQVLSRWPHGDCRVQALLGRGDELRATGSFDDAIADYSEAARAGGETLASAQAMLAQGHCWFALKKWEDAARCFLKVDVLYGFDELKPEALAMTARSWEQAGHAEQAAVYREDLKQRFPKSKEAQGP